MIILCILIMLGTWADVATTLCGFRKYGLHELSAVWKKLLTSPLLFLVLQTLFWSFVIMLFILNRTKTEFFVTLCIFRWSVVVWNVVQILKARKDGK